jgi:hypothetical protein
MESERLETLPAEKKFERLRLLTSEALVSLRAEVAGNKSFGCMSLDGIVESLSAGSTCKIEYFEHKTVLLDSNFKLVSNSGSQLTDDMLNAKSIHDAFQGLTPALATDERLWVTLALREFHEYSTERWGVSSKTPVEKTYKYFRNHVLAATPRDRWRNQSISRLWWVSNFAANLGSDLRNDAIEVFYFNSDLGQQLLGRPNISQPKGLGRAIIRVVHEELLTKNPGVWNRKRFRQFMIAIDFLIGRRKIESLPESALVEEVRSLFKEQMTP